MGVLSFLDRDHTIANAGLQPVDGAAGGAVRTSMHRPGLCVQRFQPADDETDRHHPIGARRLEAHRSRLDLLDRHLLSRACSAAVFGRWVEEGGPRRRCSRPRCCWAGGFFVSAIGVYHHMLWIIYLGYGVLGGIALGIGYISPVSTLIKWFPGSAGHGDRHGDHGLRRRRLHRFTALGLADEQVPHPDPYRGQPKPSSCSGVDLLLLHDRRRRSSCACRRPAGSRTAMSRRRNRRV